MNGSLHAALLLAGLSGCLVWRRWNLAGWLGLGMLATSLSLGLWLVVSPEPVTENTPTGKTTLVARAISDPREFEGTFQVVLDPVSVDDQPYQGPHLLGEWDSKPELVQAGVWLSITGRAWARPRRVLTHQVAGSLQVEVFQVSPPTEPWLRWGNQIRTTVLERLPPERGPATALLRGFLIGDTTGLPLFDQQSLRRAGLSHYVAVSGSNVALFLGVLFVALFPLVRSNIIRALVGIAALVLLVVITRWEASVLRASVMAAMLLISRALVLTFSGWSVLGAAVLGLLVVAPSLAGSVGFQLSVAATVGVMMGYSAFAQRRPFIFWKLLGATLGAQVMVSPLLLFWFGQIPLLSPLANLIAAPLVSVATLLGLIGVSLGGFPFQLLSLPLWIAELLAGWVIKLARVAGTWPQLATGEALLVALLLVFAVWVIRRRWWWTLAPVGAGCGVWLFFSLFGVGVDRPAVVFLDVGQGDAALVLGAEATVLVDGGPSPGRLAKKLSDYRVRSIDLLVVSHPHADHVEGLAALSGSVEVGQVWFDSDPHTTPAWERTKVMLAGDGVEIASPELGSYRLGDLFLQVLGPQRSYASVNDQSLVFRLTVGELSVLFSGDVETFAQADLSPLPVDVLKVPHQGAATSDLDWLSRVGSQLAVISVGPNRYGHPSQEVVYTLTQSGSQVLRTDEAGDVIVRPGDMGLN